MDNTEELKTLSLCSGYGGIERGIELSGQALRTVAHVEVEAYAIANLVSKMEQSELVPCPIWTNVKTLPLEPFRGVVDLLTGGYPCQPFSSAGRRLGKDDPRHLWPWICRIIDGIMPRMCFFENVEGHISLGLRQVLADLESRGYETTWGIFSASEVGASHRRKRVFIMANSNSQGRNRIRQSSRQKAQQSGITLQSWDDWPSRPGNRQHDWECSRTIKPQLDRANDGDSNRVDRIRLLGNGVVPQTAARAWITLIKEFTK